MMTYVILAYNSLRKSYFHVSFYRCMPVTLAMQRAGLGDASQSGEMLILLNLSFFVLNNLFLPNYCVKYHDYIVKWFSM